MTITLDHFGLGGFAPLVLPGALSFRPPSWPPPNDWVCVEDKDGKAVSRYGDNVWDFTPWAAQTSRFYIVGSPRKKADSPELDPANANLLRLLVALRGWGPRAFRISSVASLIDIAIQYRKVIAICRSNDILASDLSRYPAVIDKVAQAFSNSKNGKFIAEMERLRGARNILGFELLDQAGIQRLRVLQTNPPPPEQTEYIPPRIWNYLVKRVAECRNDYLAHLTEIEACFAFCVDAYEKNGARERLEGNDRKHRTPFQTSPAWSSVHSGLTFHGAFAETAQKFGIRCVIQRWVGEITSNRGIAAFSNYLTLVRIASVIDITAFSLMRKGEVANIRWDCLRWEDDPTYGRIPLIEAETTKTNPDACALWICSPSVEPSIRALQSIAKMRLASGGRWIEGGNPYLITPAFEPWGTKKPTATRVGLKIEMSALSNTNKLFPLLFDLQQLTITENDLKIAMAVCPALNPKRFEVGKPWSLGWHQFRRTGAVNMFASGEISDSSMQLQMKHLTRLMPLYYGRGNTALHLNDATRALLAGAHYEAVGRELAAMHTDRFVSPHGDDHKSRLLATSNIDEPVNLISEVDATYYAKAYRLHQVGVRLTVLGACLKNGHCDGDSVTSIGACAGGDGKAPCANVLFDVKRAPGNQKLLEGVIQQLITTQPDTPRYRHLEQEKRGLENYFAYIRQAA